MFSLPVSSSSIVAEASEDRETEKKLVKGTSLVAIFTKIGINVTSRPFQVILHQFLTVTKYVVRKNQSGGQIAGVSGQQISPTDLTKYLTGGGFYTSNRNLGLIPNGIL